MNKLMLIRGRQLLVSILLSVVLMPYGWSQGSMTREEAKAAAMVEVLKEQKDQQDRRQIDSAKADLLSQSSSSASGAQGILYPKPGPLILSVKIHRDSNISGGVGAQE